MSVDGHRDVFATIAHLLETSPAFPLITVVGEVGIGGKPQRNAAGSVLAIPAPAAPVGSGVVQVGACRHFDGETGIAAAHEAPFALPTVA